MQFYTDLEDRKEKVREFIRKNPNTTFREIKEKLHIKLNKLYGGGIEEAFKDAGINPPRTFKRMTRVEKRKIIIDYIRNNPLAGGHTIKKDTKINFQTIFKDTKEVFVAAGLEYPREDYVQLLKRDADKRRQKIIEVLKENPLMSVDQIGRLTNTHPLSLFKNMKEIYKKADVPFFSKGDKRRINKQNKVIEFVKNNKYATQREINKSCKTQVQHIFDRGIFEAYEKANVLFPFERLNLHGSALKEIKDDAVKFEKKISNLLSGYGSVNRLVRTKRGIADIILERKGRKVAIELKNYKCHEISQSQIKQLNKYLEDINSNLGFLVCLKKPKKHSFLIGSNKIFILLESELDKIPKIMDL